MIDEPLDDEGIAPAELLGDRSRPKDRQVAESRKRADADHMGTSDEFIDDRAS